MLKKDSSLLYINAVKIKQQFNIPKIIKKYFKLIIKMDNIYNYCVYKRNRYILYL